MVKTCLQCGTEFHSRASRTKYCSTTCYHKSVENPDARYHPQQRTCKTCGKDFVFRWQGTAAHKGEYCSRKCQGAGLSKMDHFVRGENHGGWKGGRVKWPGGYIAVRVDGKYVLEHRHVMEQHLGRSLLPIESVHHINGDKADNSLENLELWSSSHPKGQRVDEKLAWAREILDLYEGGV